jgi:manganese-dependent ADP-ribose/CDP-alcohol diphosphatase
MVARAREPSKPDPFSAADAASSDSDSDEEASQPRLPPTPQQLHRHASHVQLSPPKTADGRRPPNSPPPTLPTLPRRGPAAERAYGRIVTTLGVISDVQHASGIPDGRSFHGTPRYYAAALEGARRAGRAFAKEDRLRFILHLGDTVDGQHAIRGSGTSEQALGNVVDALLCGVGEGEDGAKRRQLLNLTSNHDLYNFGGADRETLNALLGIQPPDGHEGASYFSVPLAPGWRAVGLDSYDVSMLGRPEGDPRHVQAVSILRAHNPNGSEDRPQGWDSPESLHGVARRHVRFGGGASARQLSWLTEELAEARRQGERVLVLNHLPLHPSTCPPACLLWNYDQVLAVFEQFPGTVAATLAGHAHMNGYVFAPHSSGGGRGEGGREGAEQQPRQHAVVGGIHHLVLPCVLETPPDRDCWAVMDVHERGLVLRGVDTCMSLAMAIDQVVGEDEEDAEEAAERATEAEAARQADALAGTLARVEIGAAGGGNRQRK